MEYAAPLQSKSIERNGRRPGKTACSACHARKKRCDIAWPHTQCANCRKGDEICLPRAPVKRSAPQSAKDDRSRNQSYQLLDLPLPQGIDHEVPRWSALYSFYSEICRLLPPSGNDDSDLDHIGSPSSAQLESYPDLCKTSLGEHSTDNSLYQEVQLDLQYANISPMKGIIYMPASRSPSRSRNGTDSGEVACLHSSGTGDSSVLARTYCPGIWDSETVIFMNDLDKLLVF
ncbi:hypothetical protein N7517_008129 [Penicillium concentricum]|uniref:Zn(2)-C6 fungal-type domain-containing protein n=1 Tax=Penicillium concentricum TaxID=293559 RepID=A0A9W9V1E0_9EURO|nr:uncharacterized protein N7517_008129 [Penicillium concentricum]KAJ5365243.1 hypothetical protein N7517_008129 [Penicillium concentricum]